MIGIKFEVEEQEETPLPSENNLIKGILSLKFLNNSTSDTNNNGNNVSGILKQKFSEKNVVPKKVVPKKKKKVEQMTKQLDNFTTDSVAVGSKSIKTEPAESSLSLTTQLNNSLNIQSLLRQNRIQNGWTTNEQSIPIGTQQQQQTILSTKIEPIVSENRQEIPLMLDQSSFLIPNSNSGETTTTANSDIERENGRIKTRLSMKFFGSNNNNNEQDFGSGLISGVDPLSSISAVVVAAPVSPPPEAVPLIIIGKKPLRRVPPLTLEERKARNRESRKLYYLRKKTKPVDPEIRAEKQRRKSEYHRKHRQQRLANATPEQREQMRLKNLENVRQHLKNETEEQRKHRLERGRQYDRTVRKHKTKKTATSDLNHSISDSGSISGVDPSSESSTSITPEAVPLTIIGGKKSSRSPLLSLEERKALKREQDRLRYLRQKANPKSVDPEVRAEKLRRIREYHRSRRKQRLANATPEQRELMRLKNVEKCRRQLENESEEQRERRRERNRQYYHTVTKRKTNETPTLDLNRTTILKTKKRKLRKKRFELSIDDSEDSESNSETTIGTLESPKPGSSKKLPRSTRCHQRKIKLKQYLESSTDTDSHDSD